MPLPLEVAEELEALSSIYGANAFSARDETASLSVSHEDGSSSAISFHLHGYPKRLPAFELEGVPRACRAEFQERVDGILEGYPAGEFAGLLFSIAECFREVIGDTAVSTSLNPDQDGSDVPSIPAAAPPSYDIPVYRSAQPMVVMKSSFVGHCASVTSPEDVATVLSYVISDPRVARATHNIRAWRFRSATSGALVCDNDDDGETAAGSRLAMLLDNMGAENCIVIVTRWFGGTLMGPSRFKVINECARSVLEDSGIVVRKR